MFLLSRRQARTAMAATVGAATYLAASELGARKLRLTGLWILSSAAMAGMASVSGTAKARAAHKRIDVLVPAVADVASQVGGKLDKTGGTISGSVTVTGNHTVQGTLYGSGGSVSLGDHIDMQDYNLTRVSSMTPASGNLNVNISGGGLGTDGNLNLENNDIVNGGSFTFNCTGDSNAGSAPGSWNTPYIQSLANRINDILARVG